MRIFSCTPPLLTKWTIFLFVSLDPQLQKKLEYQKVSKDFQKLLVEFQKVQRISAEKQREFVYKARLTKNEYP